MRATTTRRTTGTRARWAVAAVATFGLIAGLCADDPAVADTAPARAMAPTGRTASSGTSVPVGTTTPEGTQPPPTGDSELFEGTVETSYAVPFEPDASLFVLEATDVSLWMFSDPVAVLASPPADELVADPQVGGSVDELVAWLVGHPELDSSEPEPVSIGGLDGFQVDVAITPGSTSRSPTCSPAELCVDLFASPDLNWWVGPGTLAPFVRVMLLATADDGTVVIVLLPGESLLDDGAAFHERAELLIDSLDIDFTDDTAGPGRAASTNFQPAFTYSVPDPAAPTEAAG